MDDILTTQRTLFSSRRDYANARYDYVLDSLHLKQLAGQLGPQDISELNQWLTPSDTTAAIKQIQSAGG